MRRHGPGIPTARYLRALTPRPILLIQSSENTMAGQSDHLLRSIGWFITICRRPLLLAIATSEQAMGRSLTMAEPSRSLLAELLTHNYHSTIIDLDSICFTSFQRRHRLQGPL